MKSLIIILAMMVITPIASQSIEKFSIDSGGASTAVNGIEVLYTIGEVVVQEISTPTVSLSEGFINPIANEALSTTDYQLSSANISIYPNPTSQYINIKTDVILTKIELFDVLGKQIFQSRLVINSVEVSNFKTGIYFLRLYKDSQYIVKPVVIE